MRLQLTAAPALALAAATLWPARPAAADGDGDAPRASARLGVYADDDDVLVVSPAAGAQVPVSDRVTADGEVVADTVSGASVDVVTSASPRSVHEQREELGLGLTAALPGHAHAIARVIGSHEHDDDVVWAWALGRVELADRNLDVTFGWGHGESWVTSTADAAFRARRTDDRATLRATQVLDARTYLDLLVDLTRTAGFQGSQYRQVAIADPMTSTVMRLAEATPRLRHAAAAALRLRRALGDRWYVHAGYRLEHDDWSITSHTGDALAIVEHDGARWRLGAGARLYAQGAADFWRARYALDSAGVVPTLRTRDRLLGAMWSLGGTLTVDRAVDGLGSAASRVELAVGLTRYTWPDDPLQRERMALTTVVALTTGW